jgi:2-methylisocitrate lyase-like PEP mutase family enzyme
MGLNILKYNCSENQITEAQRNRADDFFNLHYAATPLILANAWDAVSAKIFELEGFKAIGTTSAGVSSSLGYSDGEKMSWEENLSAARRIITSTNLPVSIDIEAGYSNTIDGLVKNVEDILNSGAAGINLEDGSCGVSNLLTGITEQAEKIIAIRELADTRNTKLFINARTDVFLSCGDSKLIKMYNTVRRANVYAEAGADGIFVPDMGDLDTESIRILAAEIDSPLNIIAGANTPPIPKLAELGVARVSLGPRPMRATFELLKNISRELLDRGTFSQMTNSSITYSEVNNWFN